MKFFAKLCISAILAAAAVASPSNAQTKATVSGAVVAADTKAPVAYALVHLPDAGLQAVTDNKGEFRFKAVSAGKHKVEVTFLGYEPLETVVTVKAGDSRVTIARGAHLPRRPYRARPSTTYSRLRCRTL